MTKPTPTPMEVDSLKQLKVIRSDNTTFQGLVENYTKLWMDCSHYKHKLSDAVKQNEQLVDDNYKLREELHHAQNYSRNLEKSNAVLKANLRQFLHNLEGEGIIAMKGDGTYDITI